MGCLVTLFAHCVQRIKNGSRHSAFEIGIREQLNEFVFYWARQLEFFVDRPGQNFGEGSQLYSSAGRVRISVHFGKRTKVGEWSVLGAKEFEV